MPQPGFCHSLMWSWIKQAWSFKSTSKCFCYSLFSAKFIKCRTFNSTFLTLTWHMVNTTNFKFFILKCIHVLQYQQKYLAHESQRSLILQIKADMCWMYSTLPYKNLRRFYNLPTPATKTFNSPLPAILVITKWRPTRSAKSTVDLRNSWKRK